MSSAAVPCGGDEGSVEDQHVDHELAQRVLGVDHLLSMVLSKVRDEDLGNVLLTSHSWFQALKMALHQWSWRPRSAAVSLKRGQAPTELSKLPWVYIVNLGYEPTIWALEPKTPCTCADVTRLRFCDKVVPEDLAHLLKQLRRVEDLSLDRQALGCHGLQTLWQPLSALTGLTALGLGDNKLGWQGAQALARVLPSTRMLRELRLGKNDLHARGMNFLAGPLRSLTQLQALYLQGNGLRAEGAVALASSLSCLQQLRSLSVGGNDVGVAGARELAPCVNALTQLQEIWMETNRLGDDGVRLLLWAWCPHAALKRLYLHCNNVSQPVIDAANKMWGGLDAVTW